jgi:serine/threonine-protein kinase RsbW
MDRLWRAEASVADADRMMFTTAVLEVANNIVTHNGAGSEVSIALALTADPTALRADFCDDGSPAAVDLATTALSGDLAESGRGLALARMALDEFSYERTKDRNRWQLTRHRCGERASAG